MSIVGQFLRLLSARKAIKEAIIVKGVSMDDVVSIADYPEKIAAIKAEGEPLEDFLNRKLAEAMAANTDCDAGVIYAYKASIETNTVWHLANKVRRNAYWIFSDGYEVNAVKASTEIKHTFDSTKDLQFGNNGFYRYIIELFISYKSGDLPLDYSTDYQPRLFDDNAPHFSIGNQIADSDSFVAALVAKSMLYFNGEHTLNSCASIKMLDCIAYPVAFSPQSSANSVQKFAGIDVTNIAYDWSFAGNSNASVIQNCKGVFSNIRCTATNNNLSHDSLIHIISLLATITDNTVHYLNFGTMNKAKLSDAELAVATEKGWTIS